MTCMTRIWYTYAGEPCSIRFHIEDTSGWSVRTLIGLKDIKWRGMAGNGITVEKHMKRYRDGDLWMPHPRTQGDIILELDADETLRWENMDVYHELIMTNFKDEETISYGGVIKFLPLLSYQVD